MITINLAPMDELESPYWYFPEVGMFILSLCISWFSVQTYLDSIQDEIAVFDAEIAAKNQAFATISRETSRYSQLDKDVVKLNQKLESLKSITTSRIARYRPIILLEHLQNLKPDGIWFNYIYDNSDDQIMTVVAKSFDSILVAEFMSALEATKMQEVDESDLRTQVYFEKTQLERVSTRGTPSSGGGSSGLSGSGSSNIMLRAENAGGFWNAGDSQFRELKQFPTFQLTLSYKEKSLGDNEVVVVQ